MTLPEKKTLPEFGQQKFRENLLESIPVLTYQHGIESINKVGEIYANKSN